MALFSLSRAAWVRSAPFALFMALLVLRAEAPDDGAWGFDPRWLYAVAVLAVGALLALWWREYGELSRQTWPDAREALIAVAVGLGVFALWIQLDAAWMTIGAPVADFVPLTAAGAIDMPLVAARCVGAIVVVPLMEELFWRSFLMRWLHRPVFQGLEPRLVGVKAIVLATFVFTLAHVQWLAAVIAGFAYALLYVRSGKLWNAVIAHAVTNAALAAWVLFTRNWSFW